MLTSARHHKLSRFGALERAERIKGGQSTSPVATDLSTHPTTTNRLYHQGMLYSVDGRRRNSAYMRLLEEEHTVGATWTSDLH